MVRIVNQELEPQITEDYYRSIQNTQLPDPSAISAARRRKFGARMKRTPDGKIRDLARASAEWIARHNKEEAARIGQRLFVFRRTKEILRGEFPAQWWDLADTARHQIEYGEATNTDAPTQPPPPWRESYALNSHATYGNRSDIYDAELAGSTPHRPLAGTAGYVTAGKWRDSWMAQHLFTFDLPDREVMEDPQPCYLHVTLEYNVVSDGVGNRVWFSNQTLCRFMRDNTDASIDAQILDDSGRYFYFHKLLPYDPDAGYNVRMTRTFVQAAHYRALGLDDPKIPWNRMSLKLAPAPIRGKYRFGNTRMASSIIVRNIGLYQAKRNNNPFPGIVTNFVAPTIAWQWYVIPPGALPIHGMRKMFQDWNISDASYEIPIPFGRIPCRCATNGQIYYSNRHGPSGVTFQTLADLGIFINAQAGAPVAHQDNRNRGEFMTTSGAACWSMIWLDDKNRWHNTPVGPSYNPDNPAQAPREDPYSPTWSDDAPGYPNPGETPLRPQKTKKPKKKRTKKKKLRKRGTSIRFTENSLRVSLPLGGDSGKGRLFVNLSFKTKDDETFVSYLPHGTRGVSTTPRAQTPSNLRLSAEMKRWTNSGSSRRVTVQDYLRDRLTKAGTETRYTLNGQLFLHGVPTITVLSNTHQRGDI